MIFDYCKCIKTHPIYFMYVVVWIIYKFPTLQKEYLSACTYLRLCMKKRVCYGSVTVQTFTTLTMNTILIRSYFYSDAASRIDWYQGCTWECSQCFNPYPLQPKDHKGNRIYPCLMQEGLNMYLPIVLVISVSRVSKLDYKNRSKGWACDQLSCKK